MYVPGCLLSTGRPPLHLAALANEHKRMGFGRCTGWLASGRMLCVVCIVRPDSSDTPASHIHTYCSLPWVSSRPVAWPPQSYPWRNLRNGGRRASVCGPTSFWRIVNHVVRDPAPAPSAFRQPYLCSPHCMEPLRRMLHTTMAPSSQQPRTLRWQLPTW